MTANVDDLRARIIGAVAEVAPDKPRRTWDEILYGQDFCYVLSGCNIELQL
jgi:hypothetical protein